MNKQCTCICHGNIRGVVTNRCEHCEQDTSSEEQVQTWEEEFDKQFNFLGTYNQDELGKLTVNAVKYLELKDFIRKEKQISYQDALNDVGMAMLKANADIWDVLEKLTEK